MLLQNNRFTGSLTHVFNATVQINLVTVQLSNNQLTGKLPDELFHIQTLTVFAAVSNCFTGSIPTSICGVTVNGINSSILNSNTGSMTSKLTTLALDGLQSASSCQHKISPDPCSAHPVNMKSRRTMRSQRHLGVVSPTVCFNCQIFLLCICLIMA